MTAVRQIQGAIADIDARTSTVATAIEQHKGATSEISERAGDAAAKTHSVSESVRRIRAGPMTPQVDWRQWCRRLHLTSPAKHEACNARYKSSCKRSTLRNGAEFRMLLLPVRYSRKRQLHFDRTYCARQLRLFVMHELSVRQVAEGCYLHIRKLIFDRVPRTSWLQNCDDRVGARLSLNLRHDPAGRRMSKRVKRVVSCREALPIFVQIRTYRFTHNTDVTGQQETFGERYWQLVALDVITGAVFSKPLGTISSALCDADRTQVACSVVTAALLASESRAVGCRRGLDHQKHPS